MLQREGFRFGYMGLVLRGISISVKCYCLVKSFILSLSSLLSFLCSHSSRLTVNWCTQLTGGKGNGDVLG